MHDEVARLHLCHVGPMPLHVAGLVLPRRPEIAAGTFGRIGRSLIHPPRSRTSHCELAAALRLDVLGRLEAGTGSSDLSAPVSRS